MYQVIFDKKTQCDGRVVTHGAASVKPFFGDAVHYTCQNLVLHFPPIQQSEPWLASVAVRGYPRVLCILWPSVASVRGAAYKALAVVGC